MKYKVYSYPNPPSTTVLEELSGPMFMEPPRFIFAPYIPLQITSLTIQTYRKAKLAGLKVVPRVKISEEDFKPKQGMITKYDKKATKPDFYRTVSIKDDDPE